MFDLCEYVNGVGQKTYNEFRNTFEGKTKFAKEFFCFKIPKLFRKYRHCYFSSSKSIFLYGQASLNSN